MLVGSCGGIGKEGVHGWHVGLAMECAGSVEGVRRAGRTNQHGGSGEGGYSAEASTREREEERMMTQTWPKLHMNVIY